MESNGWNRISSESFPTTESSICVRLACLLPRWAEYNGPLVMAIPASSARVPGRASRSFTRGSSGWRRPSPIRMEECISSCPGTRKRLPWSKWPRAAKQGELERQGHLSLLSGSSLEVVWSEDEGWWDGLFGKLVPFRTVVQSSCETVPTGHEPTPQTRRSR